MLGVLAPVAQWIERCPPEAEVAGSNPAGRASGKPRSGGVFTFAGAAAEGAANSSVVALVPIAVPIGAQSVPSTSAFRALGVHLDRDRVRIVGIGGVRITTAVQSNLVSDQS